MSFRERVLCALDQQKPDRVPTDLGCSIVINTSDVCEASDVCGVCGVTDNAPRANVVTLFQRAHG